MNEFTIGLLGTVGLFSSLIASVFFWFGGRAEHYLGIKNRIWGRWIAPLVFASTVCLMAVLSQTWDWWYLGSFVLYKAVSHLGYGGNTLVDKILRRSLWSLAYTSASLPFAIPSGSWVLLLTQGLVSLVVANLLGILNPLKAPQEEGVIKFSAIFLVPYMVL